MALLSSHIPSVFLPLSLSLSFSVLLCLSLSQHPIFTTLMLFNTFLKFSQLVDMCPLSWHWNWGSESNSSRVRLPLCLAAAGIWSQVWLTAKQMSSLYNQTYSIQILCGPLFPGEGFSEQGKSNSYPSQRLREGTLPWAVQGSPVWSQNGCENATFTNSSIIWKRARPFWYIYLSWRLLSILGPNSFIPILALITGNEGGNTDS